MYVVASYECLRRRTSYNVLFFLHWNVERCRWMAYFHIVHVMHCNVFFHIIIMYYYYYYCATTTTHSAHSWLWTIALRLMTWAKPLLCAEPNLLTSFECWSSGSSHMRGKKQLYFIDIIWCLHASHSSILYTRACMLYNFERQAEAPSYCRRRMLRVDPTIIGR